MTEPVAAPVSKPCQVAATLAARERFRDWYLHKRDPIARDRLLWRAQTFRHLVHLLPGQSILELGCGDGAFTRALAGVSRDENPITAVTFEPSNASIVDLPPSISFRAASSFPGPLQGQQFDFIVGRDLLDRRVSATLLREAYKLLKPSGEIVLFETNPWNPLLRGRRSLQRFGGARDSRSFMSRPQLYELMSQVGFVRIFANFTDFVYAPLTRQLAWLLRNLSIVLENAPGVRTMAGAIVVYGQKPPHTAPRPGVSMCEHTSLHDAVSVVVPCHNEEMNVGPLVRRLLQLFDDYIHEIVLVDDNSTDDTRAVMTALAAEVPRVKPVLRDPPNGVGRAIADGYRAATGKYVLSMDSDFQHLLPEMRDLFDAAADGYDVAVGSRFSRHSVLLNYPFQKIVANRGFHSLAQIVLRQRFRDLTNNLKLMRREVVDDLHLTEPGFAVNAETGLQPLVMGYRIAEVPISWVNRDVAMGTSSFQLMNVGGGYWRVLAGLLRRKLTGGGVYSSLPIARGTISTWHRRTTTTPGHGRPGAS